MDNLCHTLVGATLGQAGLKRRTRFAMATLVIGANLPDIDVLAIPFGEGLAFRRGWTHGALAWVVLPIVLTVCMVAWSRFAGPGTRPTRPAQVLLLASIAVLSHPFLDWLNNYGIRLLTPFSEEWYYGDALFIIDPWLWMGLGLGYAISRRRETRGAPGWVTPARAALGAAGLYLAGMIAGSASAHTAAAQAIHARTGAVPERLMAGPVPVDPSRRSLVFEFGDEYAFGELAWRPHLRVRLRPERVRKLDRHPAALAAREMDEVADFLYWSRFPFFRIEQGDGGTWVVVADARYATPGEDGWAVVRVFVPGD